MVDPRPLLRVELLAAMETNNSCNDCTAVPSGRSETVTRLGMLHRYVLQHAFPFEHAAGRVRQIA